VDGFADVVAGCAMSILAAGWASGAGPGGFWRLCGVAGLRSEVAKSAADAGGAESFGSGGIGGSFPGAAQVAGEAAGEPELGVRGEDEPGPGVRGVRVTQAGPGPAEGLFEQPEGVLEVEAAQVCLPEQVDLGGGEVGG